MTIEFSKKFEEIRINGINELRARGNYFKSTMELYAIAAANDPNDKAIFQKAVEAANKHRETSQMADHAIKLLNEVFNKVGELIEKGNK